MPIVTKDPEQFRFLVSGPENMIILDLDQKEKKFSYKDLQKIALGSAPLCFGSKVVYLQVNKDDKNDIKLITYDAEKCEVMSSEDFVFPPQNQVEYAKIVSDEKSVVYQSYDDFMQNGLIAIKLKVWSFRKVSDHNTELFKVDAGCYLWSISSSPFQGPNHILIWNQMVSENKCYCQIEIKDGKYRLLETVKSITNETFNYLEQNCIHYNDLDSFYYMQNYDCVEHNEIHNSIHALGVHSLKNKETLRELLKRSLNEDLYDPDKYGAESIISIFFQSQTHKYVLFHADRRKGFEKISAVVSRPVHALWPSSTKHIVRHLHTSFSNLFITTEGGKKNIIIKIVNDDEEEEVIKKPITFHNDIKYDYLNNYVKDWGMLPVDNRSLDLKVTNTINSSFKNWQVEFRKDGQLIKTSTIAVTESDYTDTFCKSSSVMQADKGMFCQLF